MELKTTSIAVSTVLGFKATRTLSSWQDVTREIQQHVTVHLGEEITTRKAAELLHLNRQHFCRLFKVATGTTFASYVCCLRIERAKEFLRDPRCRVKEAAFQCGFKSVAHFDRVFRHHEGMSPLQYQATNSQHKATNSQPNAIATNPVVALDQLQR